MAKESYAYRSISEVSERLGIAAHVLRYWETRFPQIRPVKGPGGRRHYRPEDIEAICHIRSLLHDKGYSIREAREILRKPETVKEILGSASLEVTIASEAAVNTNETIGKAAELMEPENLPSPDASNNEEKESITEAQEASAAPSELEKLQATLAEIRRRISRLQGRVAALQRKPDADENIIPQNLKGRLNRLAAREKNLKAAINSLSQAEADAPSAASEAIEAPQKPVATGLAWLLMEPEKFQLLSREVAKNLSASLAGAIERRNAS